MITYELAKKLKDAGFPQDKNQLKCPHGTWIGVSGQNGCCGDKVYLEGEKHGVFYPPLSELIEACGDNFFGLFKCDAHAGGGHCWKAEGKNSFGKVLMAVEEYQTPEEAVANLWLRLNK